MNPFRLFTSLFSRAIDRELIIGSWRDADGQFEETYARDGRVFSKIDQRLTVPVNESGFVGTSSSQVSATLHGTWSLRGKKLVVELQSFENLIIGPVTLHCENDTFDDEFISRISDGMQEQLTHEVPKMIAGDSTVVTIVSVSKNKLVTRDSSGEIEEHCRVDHHAVG